MSQIFESRTPTGSPKKSPFKPIYPRNSSPVVGRHNLIRKSPLKFSTRCPTIDKDTRRKSMFISNVRNDPISTLARSNSLQNMNIMNINSNKSLSSSPVRSNSGSPLKNLVKELNGYERSSPVRRNASPCFSHNSRSNENNASHLTFDNIPFSFYEESQSDREAVLEQYFTKNTMIETLVGQENASPNVSTTKTVREIPQNKDINRTVFKELTSKEYGGSITDPKTKKTIYLHYYPKR